MNKCIDYEKESRERFWWLNKTGGSAHDSLTVMDYFAAKAMVEMMNYYTEDAQVAEKAYNLAEAMMNERTKRESNDA